VEQQEVQALTVQLVHTKPWKPLTHVYLSLNAGGASDQLNYAQGTKQVAVRSQNVALSGEENIDFDVGRRRRLQAIKHRGHNARRRLHAARAAARRQQ
jgi:hypothetical protein